MPAGSVGVDEVVYYQKTDLKKSVGPIALVRQEIGGTDSIGHLHRVEQFIIPGSTLCCGLLVTDEGSQ
jgi:hypothetical protein